MTEIFRGYVRTENKKCIQKFGHGEPLLTLTEAMQYSEFAGVLNGQYTVKDVDDGDEAERLLQLVSDLNLNCRVYRTTRGFHFVFKNSRHLNKNLTKAVDALGFGFDTRYGRNAYIIAKFGGLVREIVREFDEAHPIDEYPHYLAQIRGGTQFTGMGDGSGRNAALFRHIGTLIRNGFSKEEIRQAIQFINRYSFSDSLSDEEISKITRDESFENISSAADDFKSSGKLVFTEQVLNDYLAANNISIRYNVINKAIDIKGIAGGYNPETLQNDLPIIIYDTLKMIYIKCDKGAVQDLLGVIAGKNRFNPVADMLTSGEWDRHDRLPEFYEILGIPISDTLSRILIYKFLWQAISMSRNEFAEAYGADGVLVLQGRQGIGKTSLVRKLAVRPELCKLGQHLDSRDKDTYRRAVSAWIVEFGEIESTFRSDLERLKAFITAEIDEYRLPYGRADQTLARRTVIIGTCNSDRFLIDPTGSRRFWTIPLTDIDLDALNKFDALQLWFQIDSLTKNNPQGFRLTKDEQAQLSERNGEHEKLLPAQAEIMDIMAKSNTVYRETTVTEFKKEHSELFYYTADQISKALNKLGVEQRSINFTVNGKRTSARVRSLPMWHEEVKPLC